MISCTPKADYIQSKYEPLSYLLLTPVFFACIGINAQVDGMDGAMVVFSIALLVVSVISKLVGCGLGAGSATSPDGRASRWVWAWSAGARWL